MILYFLIIHFILYYLFLFFFFQAEDGIRDVAVTGVQTCALPILASKYGYESALYGHYGQGCIHARWNFDLVTRDGIRTFRRFLEDASDLVLSLEIGRASCRERV